MSNDREICNMNFVEDVAGYIPVTRSVRLRPTIEVISVNSSRRARRYRLNPVRPRYGRIFDSRNLRATFVLLFIFVSSFFLYFHPLPLHPFFFFFFFFSFFWGDLLLCFPPMFSIPPPPLLRLSVCVGGWVRVCVVECRRARNRSAHLRHGYVGEIAQETTLFPIPSFPSCFPPPPPLLSSPPSCSSSCSSSPSLSLQQLKINVAKIRRKKNERKKERKGNNTTPIWFICYPFEDGKVQHSDFL